LSEQFANDYRVALPDRTFGLAFSTELGPKDLGKMHEIVRFWHMKGPQALVSGTYEPEGETFGAPGARTRLRVLGRR
jgi:hypothetical protein